MSTSPAINPAVVHVGDDGFPIRIKVVHLDASGQVVTTDISSATALEVKMQAANGDQITKPGVFVTDGSDGEYEYVVEPLVIDIAGLWYVFGHLELAGWSGHTEVGLMEVRPVLF